MVAPVSNRPSPRAPQWQATPTSSLHSLTPPKGESVQNRTVGPIARPDTRCPIPDFQIPDRRLLTFSTWTSSASLALKSTSSWAT